MTDIRLIANNIRKNIITAIYNAQSGHPGGSLGIADILAVLYFRIMDIDPPNPSKKDRDRFVLSKGHCAPALYSTLAERGYFSKEQIKTYRIMGSILQGHPDCNCTPGVDVSSGSLGHGFSTACGIALGGMINKIDYRVFALLGDGELEEGQVWEAAMFAAHYRLNRLTVIIDNNGLQIDGEISNVMSPYPIKDKFLAFGWNVIEIDGHDHGMIFNALNVNDAKNDKPLAIIAKTVKGKGVSFMENKVEWHGTPPDREQYETAMKELNEIEQKIVEKNE